MLEFKNGTVKIKSNYERLLFILCIEKVKTIKDVKGKK